MYCHFCNEVDNVGLFAEVAVPLRPGFDLDLRVLSATGEENLNWGAGVGAHIALGGARPQAAQTPPKAPEH